MTKQPLISLPFLLVFLYLSTSKALAQSPAHAPSHQDHQAQAPAAQAPDQPLVRAPPRKSPHPAPPNVTDILDKAGGFSTFIRLLKNTQVINQIESQLNNSNNDLTILAPTNDAFSGLKPGTLNTLTNEEKVQLLQFHLIPSFESVSNFQTISNPVRTQASNTHDYPLNITTTGGSVNITTGIVNTTISGTVYSDNQLAIYRVDKVLLPLAIFAPNAPSPSPSPASSPSPLKSPSSPKPRSASASPPAVVKPKKEQPAASTTSVNIPPVASLDLSGGVGIAVIDMASSVGVAVVAGVFLWGRPI
ncbi:fasciclin-like arabinogalactan protein 12 [Ziziphus jujuba]|uniref:Fasciclin-like arabinogalactan protein 12 n=1 Tax=Ziziphus jujuba TaxID=326968 RepID=A0A6P4A8D3_ZIZJJ|nr:fasciclin-like arabinogalactan protein 12 [Ziziphus jujuba]